MATDHFTIIHECAAGLDVHKKQITATILRQTTTAEPAVMTETFSTLPKGLNALSAWLLEHQVTGAAMEATGIYWETPYEALEAKGMPVKLVNAQHVKQLKGQKTDIADSIWLARVCQFDLARGSMVPPRVFRQLRKISRHRRRLIQQRASARNRIHKTLDRSGCLAGVILSDLFGMNGRRILRGLINGDDGETILASLSGHVSRHLASLAGVCPGNHESAGKRRQVGTRRGSRHISSILNQCGHAAARTKDCQFHGYHKALQVRRGFKRALVATSHKLLRTMWAVLRDEQPYMDPDIDYEALVIRRNASRWLRQLNQHGYLDSLRAVARMTSA